MTAGQNSTSLQQLEERLLQTNLDLPRPIVDMGLTEAQKERLQQSFKLQPENMRPAAVLIPMQIHQQQARIILTRRADDLRHHPGQISFPGGSQEASDDDLAETALRESYEEIGLNPGCVRVIGYLPDYPTITGFCVTPVVGVVEEAAEVLPDQQEVTAIHYLPLEALIEGRGIRHKTIERDGHHYPITEIVHNGVSIWGATAGMLIMLRKELLAAAEAA